MGTEIQLSKGALDCIRELIYGVAGITLGHDKDSMIRARLAGRLRALHVSSYESYLERVSRDRDELSQLVDLLTTNETYFFRESAHFDRLADEVAQRRPASLRVWSAASSFGDEAYTTAMLLADLQQRGQIGADWSILGTDISDRVLRSAMQAIYPNERLRNVTPERLKRYCWRGEGDAEGLSQIQPRLREHVRFGQLNLCLPIEAIGPFDVVFLRNVLIYFDPPTKIQVVDRVLSQLRPGGILFLGTAEGRVPCKTPLQPLAPGAFRKVAA